MGTFLTFLPLVSVVVLVVSTTLFVRSRRANYGSSQNSRLLAVVLRIGGVWFALGGLATLITSFISGGRSIDPGVGVAVAAFAIAGALLFGAHHAVDSKR